MLAEKRFRRGTNAESFGKSFVTAVRYPCNLGCEAFNVLLFLSEKGLGDNSASV